MTTPTPLDVHVNVYATNISVAYRNSTYIADQILPLVPVTKKSGLYAKYTKADWFRNATKLRAPGALPAEVDYTLATAGEYSCLPYAIAKRVPWETRENADPPLRPDNEAVEFITDQILLAREIRIASLLFSGTTFSGYTAGVTALTGGGQVAWDTHATSTPIVDIEQMKENVRTQIGRRPNTLILGAAVWKALKWHPDLLDLIKYTQKGVVTEDLLASLVGMRVLVGDPIYSDTAEGVAFSSSDIWGKYALAAYISPTPSLMSPSLGYTLAWTGMGGLTRSVERYELTEGQKATKYVVEEHSDEIVAAADAGYLLSAVVS